MKPGAIRAMDATGAIGALGAMLVLSAANVYAQAPQEISLEDAVTMALEREPALRAARFELDVARGMRRQAGLSPNPSVMFERREEPSGTDNQTTVQVSLPLDLFRRSARIQVADREIDVVERSVADRARILVNDVKLRYGQAAAALRDRTVADDVAAAVRRDLELLKRRVDEGASPPLDRNRLDVEARRLESLRLLAAGRAESAMIELKRTLSLSAGAPLVLHETLEVLSPAAVGDSLSSLQRADVLEAEARMRLADARIEEAQSEGRIDLSIIGSYMRMDAGFPQEGFGPAGSLERVRGVFNYVAGGAMVMVPLWNRNQGRVDVARAERMQAAAQLEAVRLAAETQRAAALAQVTHAKQALALMAASVQLARQNLDVMRQTYELGRGTLADVLAEQRRYLDIEQEYTEALRAAFEARAALEFAEGASR